jgi:hypothetical protein
MRPTIPEIQLRKGANKNGSITTCLTIGSIFLVALSTSNAALHSQLLKLLCQFVPNGFDLLISLSPSVL